MNRSKINHINFDEKFKFNRKDQNNRHSLLENPPMRKILLISKPVLSQTYERINEMIVEYQCLIGSFTFNPIDCPINNFLRINDLEACPVSVFIRYSYRKASSKSSSCLMLESLINIWAFCLKVAKLLI